MSIDQSKKIDNSDVNCHHFHDGRDRFLHYERGITLILNSTLKHLVYTQLKVIIKNV